MVVISFSILQPKHLSYMYAHRFKKSTSSNDKLQDMEKVYLDYVSVMVGYA